MFSILSIISLLQGTPIQVLNVLTVTELHTAQVKKEELGIVTTRLEWTSLHYYIIHLFSTKWYNAIYRQTDVLSIWKRKLPTGKLTEEPMFLSLLQLT